MEPVHARSPRRPPLAIPSPPRLHKYILKYMGVIENAAVRPPNPDAGEARASEAYEVLLRVGALDPAPAP